LSRDVKILNILELFCQNFELFVNIHTSDHIYDASFILQIFYLKKRVGHILFTTPHSCGDHRAGIVLCGWRLSSKTWNPKTSPWM